MKFASTASYLVPEVLEIAVNAAETYASEGNAVAADSAYATVASTYPTSQRAPTALYKRAIALQAAGQTANARALLESVVTRFPRSDEAALARERLRAIK